MLTLFLSGRRRWMSLLVLAAVGLCCALGLWQLDRLAQRQARNATINARMAAPAVPLDGTLGDPDALDYRRVQVRGTYDPEQEIVLRPRSLDGIAGVHVITPLRLSGSDAAVLVDRGWVPLNLAAPLERRAYAEPGEVIVQGIARRSQAGASGPQEPPLQPGQTRRDGWFRVDIAQIEQQTGYKLLPLFIEQQPGPDDPELPRRIVTGDTGPGSHLSYTFQWFSFALILLIGYPALLYHQNRRPPTADHRPPTTDR
jgi:surfeit locus 1 family protein